VSPSRPAYAEGHRELVIGESDEEVALLEIAPVGDFLSEFAVDFGSTH